MKILSIAEIEQIYSPGIGRHWFDSDSMRFFKSRLAAVGYQHINGSVYFVSSEKGPDKVRRYSVRMLTGPRGNVRTVGEFQQYKNSRAAETVARQLAAAIERDAA